MVAERIGPYRLDQRLGAGGMGVVYRAWDERLNRAVAIKLIPGQRPEGLTRFRREARAIAQLNHPSIVQIYDLLEWEGHECIVMELVEGDSLANLVAEGPLPVERGLQLAREITDALAHAHAHGVIHRDLKAANVMVFGGHAKILDFGVAKLRHRSAEAPLTDAGTILGTVSSMAPEQVEEKPIDHRSDLFSLGTLLYQIFTGQLPFSGNNPVKTLMMVVHKTQQPAWELNPELPEELSALIDSLLEKDPERRPQSAEEVGRALAAIGKTIGVFTATRAFSTMPYMARQTREEDDHAVENLIEEYESALQLHLLRRRLSAGQTPFDGGQGGGQRHPPPEFINTLSGAQLIHLLHQRLTALKAARS